MQQILDSRIFINYILQKVESLHQKSAMLSAELLNISLSAAKGMFARRELEVVAVIKGDPQFDQTKHTPLFPGF